MQSPRGKAEIRNEEEKSAEEIHREACEIFAEAKSRWKSLGITPENAYNEVDGDLKIAKFEKQLDDIYNEYRDKHQALFSSYPTVMRHMLQEMIFKPGAFMKYLKSLEKKPWTNDNERMDSYTEYYILLIRARHKGRKLTKTIIEENRKFYRGKLQEEHDSFVKKVKEFQGEIEKMEENDFNEMKDDLIKVLETRLEDNSLSNAVAINKPNESLDARVKDILSKKD